jgi:hypothetical protein
MDTPQAPSQADLEVATLKAKVLADPIYVPPQEQPAERPNPPGVDPGQQLFESDRVYKRPWHMSPRVIVDEPAPANLTPEQMRTLEIEQGRQLAWAKLFAETLKSVARPPLSPALAGLNAVVDEKLAALMEPVQIEWRAGKAFAELERVRAMLKALSRDHDKAQAKLAADRAKFDELMATGREYPRKQHQQVAESIDAVERVERELVEVKAGQFIQVHDEAHLDLHDRLVEAALKASQEADARIKGLYRDLTRMIGEVLPQIAEEQKLKAACMRSAIETRFASLLTDLA